MNIFMKNKIILLLFLILVGNIQAFSIKNSLGLGNKLQKNRDKITGNVAYLLSQGPTWFPSLYSHTPENILFKISELKAKKIFWQTYNTVPAYQDFIEKNCPNGLPKVFKDIPVMNKSNYIKKYDLAQTLVFGQFPLKGQIDMSTGTSGKPTTWIRGQQEMKNIKYWIRVASKVAVGSKPYIFCNMFALGPWATGMTSTYALSENQLVVSIGPNFEKLYDILRDFGPQHHYVIAGYPPHMKKLVENVPFDLTAYDITIVVGGEAMSENVYNSLIRSGIKEIYSSYGASDLRINIAQQTEFEQKLQHICKENSQFKKELLGSCEGTPMFFHYNPLLDYIEETEDGYLLFTDLDQTRVSPRIRYDLGDKGKILKISFVNNLLAKYDYELKPRSTLPILCLYGRGDDALTFNGANLMYDELENALAKIPSLLSKVNRYAYNKFENKNLDQQLEFWIELKSNINFEDLTINLEALNQQLITALSEDNPDFRAQVEYIQNNKDSHLPLPCTFIYEYGKSPMAKQDAHHKNKYVYNVIRH